MIIRIIPETEQEKANMKRVEHTGIKEYFIFGNKVDEEGTLIDWHEWKSGYRYLIGSLHYYSQLIANEQKEKSSSGGKEITIKPMSNKKMIKFGESNNINIEIPKEQEMKPEEMGQVIQMPTDAFKPKEEVKNEEFPENKE
jgi:hypothetical protein